MRALDKRGGGGGVGVGAEGIVDNLKINFLTSRPNHMLLPLI